MENMILPGPDKLHGVPPPTDNRLPVSTTENCLNLWYSYLNIFRTHRWQILVHMNNIPKVIGRTKKTAAIIKPRVFMPGCFLTLPGVKLDLKLLNN